jgi:spore coat protein CotH
VVTTTAAPQVVPVVIEEFSPDAPTGFDEAAELFRDDVIPEFELELSDEAIDALRSDPYTWVEGALVYEGARFEPVGIRLKGQNSFLPIDEKPSLKVKLDEYVDGLDLLGLEEIAFDNMSTDFSMMHERVSYRLFREVGVPAARANHAVIRVNGEDRGLYTMVENVDEDLLELWYPDSSGVMWELADVEFTDVYVDWFELESGPDDRAALQAIADALELGGKAAYDAAADWVDWDQFVDFVAAAAVAGQFDCYPWRSPGDDAHLYFDPADGKMDFLPHGMDETFVRETRSVYDGSGLLFAACLADPGCADDYESSIWDAQAIAESIDLLGYAKEVRDQIEALAEDDPARPYTMADVEAGQDEMLDFIENRADQLSALIGGP